MWIALITHAYMFGACIGGNVERIRYLPSLFRGKSSVVMSLYLEPVLTVTTL